MRKIPKVTKTSLCFVAKISSPEEEKTKFSLCSQWVNENENKALGFTCMNYGKTEPKLQGTLFYIFSLRNKNSLLENGQILMKFLENNGFYQVNESDREVDKLVKIIG